MPSEEAGYTYAVEPAATNRLLANEEESIYGLSVRKSIPNDVTLHTAFLMEINFRSLR
jgi:hypothetical protein